MASKFKAKELTESERIREVVRRLRMAIVECEAYLAEVEEAVRHSRDNDPPR